MKQILLALILLIVPVGAFTTFQVYMTPHAAPVASLGDLSNLKTIVADTTAIAKTGDMAATEKRITDFETAWDDAQEKMRPLNPEAWGVVDGAADQAIRSVRAATPDVSAVKLALLGLSAALDNPTPEGSKAGTIIKVAGITVTDANGHALPCETMLAPLRDSIINGKVAQANLVAANDFVTKATERCNADDDTHADEFSAQGLALVTN
jgi:hypothetical protein